MRVTARFSNGGGDPGIPDYAKEGRGLAVKFYLPDGSRTDVVALSLPCFFARTPEDFIEFTRARKPDPETGQPDFGKIGAWLEAHPEAGPAIQAAVTADPPESYATVTYNSIHSFRWTAPDGTERHVRYRFEPEAGEHTLSDEDAKARGRDYLQEEIASRDSSAFRMIAVIAEDGDAVDDPTIALPEERERVELGRLELTGLDTERERDGDILVFDPTRSPTASSSATTKSSASARGRTRHPLRAAQAHPRRRRGVRPLAAARGQTPGCGIVNWGVLWV